MKIVVDASAVLALLLRTPVAAKVAERLRKAQGNVHAPHLLDVEVTEVLHRHAAAHPEQAERCRQALCDLREMPVFRHSYDVLFDRVWELRENFTASDASYVALAEFLSAPLLTCDDRLLLAGDDVKVEVLSATEQLSGFQPTEHIRH